MLVNNRSKQKWQERRALYIEFIMRVFAIFSQFQKQISLLDSVFLVEYFWRKKAN